MERNAAHRRKVVEQDALLRRMRSLEKLLEELHDAVIRYAAKEIWRHDERSTEPQTTCRARQTNTIAKGGCAGSNHHAFARQTAARNRLHEAYAFVRGDRGRFAGRSEHIERIASRAQQLAVVRDGRFGIRPQVRVERRDDRRANASQSRAHLVKAPFKKNARFAGRSASRRIRYGNQYVPKGTASRTRYPARTRSCANGVEMP